MPRISVLIPTYNGAAHLEACLDSLLAQTLSDFEIVVCDDGSTDGTWPLLQNFATREPRCRLHRNARNLGLVANWNRCIELARGEWLKFVFQDDLLMPKCLARFSERLDPGTPLLFCRRRFLFADDTEADIRRHYDSLPNLDSLFPGRTVIPAQALIDAVLTRTRQNFLGEPTSALIHRSAFERFGRFDEDLVQFCDLEYWIRVGIHTGIAYIPETLAQFRVHRQSTSRGNRNRFRSEYLDGLLILNAWCHHPAYAPLRRQARRLGRNLKRELARQAFWLERYLNELGRERPELLTEWQDLIGRHPEIFRNPHLWPLRAREWLDRHLLWRLKSRDPS